MQEFRTFYQENLGLIYRYVFSKVRNREEAEDLTSQIFLKAVRSIDFNHGVDSAQGWLFRVAKTTIVDYWRAHYRGASSSLEVLLEAGWEGPIHEQEYAPMSSSAEDRVQRILQALPKRDREVLTCRFLLNLSVRETALRMGLSEANVKTIQYRALKRAAGLEDVAAENAC